MDLNDSNYLRYLNKLPYRVLQKIAVGLHVHPANVKKTLLIAATFAAARAVTAVVGPVPLPELEEDSHEMEVEVAAAAKYIFPKGMYVVRGGIRYKIIDIEFQKSGEFSWENTTYKLQAYDEAYEPTDKPVEGISLLDLNRVDYSPMTPLTQYWGKLVEMADSNAIQIEIPDGSDIYIDGSDWHSKLYNLKKPSIAEYFLSPFQEDSFYKDHFFLFNVGFQDIYFNSTEDLHNSRVKGVPIFMHDNFTRMNKYVQACFYLGRVPEFTEMLMREHLKEFNDRSSSLLNAIESTAVTFNEKSLEEIVGIVFSPRDKPDLRTMHTPFITLANELNCKNLGYRKDSMQKIHQQIDLRSKRLLGELYRKQTTLKWPDVEDPSISMYKRYRKSETDSMFKRDLLERQLLLKPKRIWTEYWLGSLSNLQLMRFNIEGVNFGDILDKAFRKIDRIVRDICSAKSGDGWAKLGDVWANLNKRMLLKLIFTLMAMFEILDTQSACPRGQFLTIVHSACGMVYALATFFLNVPQKIIYFLGQELSRPNITNATNATITNATNATNASIITEDLRGLVATGDKDSICIFIEGFEAKEYLKTGLSIIAAPFFVGVLAYGSFAIVRGSLKQAWINTCHKISPRQKIVAGGTMVAAIALLASYGGGMIYNVTSEALSTLTGILFTDRFSWVQKMSFLAGVMSMRWWNNNRAAPLLSIVPTNEQKFYSSIKTKSLRGFIDTVGGAFDATHQIHREDDRLKTFLTKLTTILQLQIWFKIENKSNLSHVTRKIQVQANKFTFYWETAGIEEYKTKYKDSRRDTGSQAVPDSKQIKNESVTTMANCLSFRPHDSMHALTLDTFFKLYTTDEDISLLNVLEYTRNQYRLEAEQTIKDAKQLLAAKLKAKFDNLKATLKATAGGKRGEVTTAVPAFQVQKDADNAVLKALEQNNEYEQKLCELNSLYTKKLTLRSLDRGMRLNILKSMGMVEWSDAKYWVMKPPIKYINVATAIILGTVTPESILPDALSSQTITLLNRDVRDKNDEAQYNPTSEDKGNIGIFYNNRMYKLAHSGVHGGLAFLSEKDLKGMRANRSEYPPALFDKWDIKWNMFKEYVPPPVALVAAMGVPLPPPPPVGTGDVLASGAYIQAAVQEIEEYSKVQLSYSPMPAQCGIVKFRIEQFDEGKREMNLEEACNLLHRLQLRF